MLPARTPSHSSSASPTFGSTALSSCDDFPHARLNRPITTALGTSLAHNAVDLVDEYGARLVEAGQLEEDTDELLAFSSPF